MPKGKITGSIATADGRTFRSGDEAEFSEWLDAMEPEARKRSLAHLAKHRQIDGFGAKAAELTEADPTLAARPEDDDEEHNVVDATTSDEDETEAAPGRGRARGGKGKR